MLGNLSFSQTRLGKISEAEKTSQTALQLLNSIDTNATWEKAWILGTLAVSLFYQNKEKQGLAISEEAAQLYHESEDYVLFGTILMGQAQSLHQLGEYKQAELLAQKSKEVLDELGEQLYSLFCLSTLGRLAMERGDYQEAETFHRHCLEKRDALGLRPGMAFSLHDLGDVSRHQGKDEEARAYYQQSIAIAREINMPHNISQGLWGLGNLAVSMGQYDLAKTYFYESLHSGGRNQRMLGGAGWAELGLGNLAAARQYFYSELERLIALSKMPAGIDALAGLAHVIAMEGRLSQAVELLSLIQYHPATAQETKYKVIKLWEELTAELPPDLITEAEARGKGMDLFETAKAILAEGPNS